MSFLDEIDFKYRNYDDWMSDTVAHALRKRGWEGPNQRGYADAKYDALIDHFKNDIQEEYASLSEEARREALQAILAIAEDELGDDYVEKHAQQAVIDLVLIDLVKKELGVSEETSQSIVATVDEESPTQVDS